MKILLSLILILPLYCFTMERDRLTKLNDSSLKTINLECANYYKLPLYLQYSCDYLPSQEITIPTMTRVPKKDEFSYSLSFITEISFIVYFNRNSSPSHKALQQISFSKITPEEKSAGALTGDAPWRELKYDCMHDDENRIPLITIKFNDSIVDRDDVRINASDAEDTSDQKHIALEFSSKKNLPQETAIIIIGDRRHTWRIPGPSKK